MALKGDRYEGITDIAWHMNEVAERGGIATLSTAGSGAAMDQSQNLATYAANPSGAVPLGILLNDMVNKDLTRTKINEHKNEHQKGGKVTLLKEGYVVTNMVRPDIVAAPVGSETCFVGPSGLLDTAEANGAFPIGEFQGVADEDGYTKVYVKLPTSGPRPTLA
jgi:hypothetical protein